MSRRRSWLSVVPAVWRSAGVGVVLEIPLLVAVATLVAFFVTLPLKAPMDGFLFQTRAGYASVAVASGGPPPRGALVVDRLVGFPVAPAPGPGETLAYTPLATRLHLDVVDDMAAYRVLAIGGNFVNDSGRPGLLIDADSALHMHLHVGDDAVLLTSLLIDNAPSPIVKIAGILEPYDSPDGTRQQGLAVIDRSLLPSGFLEAVLGGQDLVSVSHETLTFDPVSGTDSRTRSAMAADFVLRLFSGDWFPALGGLLGSAIVLLVAVVARSGGHALRRTAGPAAVVAALGVTPSEAASAATIPQLVLTVASLLAGAAVAMRLVFPSLLGWTVQLGAIAPALAILGLVACVHTVIARSRFASRLRHGALVALLAPTEE